MSNFLWYSLVIICGIAGAALALYIYKKKNKKKEFVCPIGGRCLDVVQSDYSKFLGIPVEVSGIGYYSFITLTYVMFMLFPVTMLPEVVFIVLGITFMAFLFSLYLTSLQAFVIKEWCTWCLSSALLTTLIFIFSFISNFESVIPIIVEYKSFIYIIHLFGIAIGLGGATVTGVLFINFLKQFLITKKETEVIHTITNIMWFALGVTVLSGVGLGVAQESFSMPYSVLSGVMIFVLLAGGLFKQLYLIPCLCIVSTDDPATEPKGKEFSRGIRKMVFMTGAVTMSTWYGLFLVALLDKDLFNLKWGLTIYAMIVLISVIKGFLVEKYLEKITFI